MKPKLVCVDTNSIANTLNDVKELFEGEKIVGVISYFKNDEQEVSCYQNNFFILMAITKDEFRLSFTLNDYEIESVAYYTHLLTLLLHDKLSIVEDSFYDGTIDKWFFGDVAYEKYEDFVHIKNGFVFCGVCEQYIPKDIYLEEKQYCKQCEQELPFVIFN